MVIPLKHIALLLWLCMTLLATTNSDNAFNKYLSIKKPQAAFGPRGIIGIYKNYLLTTANNNLYMVDVETGLLVKTITG
jgi:hypothetical protein